MNSIKLIKLSEIIINLCINYTPIKDMKHKDFHIMWKEISAKLAVNETYGSGISCSNILCRDCVLNFCEDNPRSDCVLVMNKQYHYKLEDIKEAVELYEKLNRNVE